MLDPDVALKILEQTELSPRREVVPLAEALGRVLAEPLSARVDSPPFSKAAMDGFALSSTDLSDRYRVLETIAAGDVPQQKITPGGCSKVL